MTAEAAMTRLVPLVLIGALGLGTLACERKPAPAAPAGSGVSLVQVSGGISRTTGAGQPAPPAGALAVGDRLVTGDDGAALIRLADGRELELGPGSRLRVVAAGAAELQVELEAGTIVSRVDERPASLAVSVLTPFGITRLPRAPGEAALDVRADGASVAVALGSVEFVDRQGQVTRAAAGETLEVSVGGVQVITAEKPRTVTGDAIEVVLTSERGRLLVRRPGSASFTAERSLAPAPGTAYRVTGGDGRARLQAGRLRARLSTGAGGRVGEARQLDTGDRYELGLDTGSALLQLDGEGPQELQLPLGKQRAGLYTRGPAAVKLLRAGPGKPLAVTVLLGELELQLGDRRRRLGAGETALLSDRGFTAAARTPAAITLPTARGLQVHADTLEEVTLSWPAELANVRIEVASDPQFKDIVLAGASARPAVTVPAPRRGDLYWRVQADKGGAPTTLLGHARFLPDRGRSVLDLANPRNLVSETGEVTTVYFQSVLPALTLSFAGKPGARRYRIRVYRAGALDRPLIEREVTSPPCVLEPGALAEGSYLWHAVPLDAQGREASGGLMNKLELVYDNALNTLAIGSPKPGARVSGPDVQVSGIAPIGSKLYVNGQPAPLDGKGRFDMRVQRSPAVIFRLLEHDGSQRYWVRALRLRS